MAKRPVKHSRTLSGLTTRRCPICRGERLTRSGFFLPHWNTQGQSCPGGGKRAASVSIRRD